MSKHVSAIIWPRREQSAANAAPSRKGPWIQFVVMAGVGLLFFFFEHTIMAYVLWGISALLLSGLLFFPGVLRGFEKTGRGLARGIGAGITWLLLVPFFYVVFSAGRLFLRLRGRDPMRRVLDPSMSSYWTPHRKLDIEARYHRQF